MCSLHLTHPSVHTWSSGQPTVQRPGSRRGLPVGAGIRTHNLGLPRVSSPTLYPLGQRLPNNLTRASLYPYPQVGEGHESWHKPSVLVSDPQTRTGQDPCFVRHDIREKNVLLPECMLQTKQSVKTKEVDDVFSRHPMYCGRAGSNVIGQQIMFLCVCFRHRSHWRRSP